MGGKFDFGGKRILVTGHSGFSGTWLSHMLGIQNAEIQGFSRDDSEFSTVFTENRISEAFPTTFGNILKGDDFSRQIEMFQPHIVVHLAAQSLVKEGYKNPVDTFATNAVGTAQVLHSSLLSKSLKGVIAITTDKVYAESDDIKFETSPLGGSDPYSCSKVAAEEAVRAFRDEYVKRGISLSVMRGGNIIGGGDWSNNRLVPDLVRAHYKGEKLKLRLPDATRPWQHVLDLVYSYSLVAWNMLENSGPETNTEYNVGPAGESRLSVMEIVKLFSKNGLPVEYSVIPEEQHESRFLQINSSKISHKLGWSPKIPAEAAVRITSVWYKMVLDGKSDPHELTRQQIMEYLDDRRH